jgi:succinate dehydrogenase / fumarate reductase cytochrome b subunit
MLQQDPMRTSDTSRPRFLTLWQIQFPVGAIVSICHRLSGVVLLLILPVLALALDRSLRSAADYAQLIGVLRSRAVAPLIVVAAWALAHHLAAGIRHLLMDIGIGAPLAQARASAKAAIGAGLAAALLAALWWLA